MKLIQGRLKKGCAAVPFAVIRWSLIYPRSSLVAGFYSWQKKLFHNEIRWGISLYMGTPGICLSAQCKSKLLLIPPSPALLRGKGPLSSCLHFPNYLICSVFTEGLGSKEASLRHHNTTRMALDWRGPERIRWQRWGYVNYPQECKGLKHQRRSSV